MGKDPEKRIMLERVKDSGSGIPERVRIAEASFPAPFPRSLEYNAPAHGTWNIVHIGMTVPQSHSIYVCADNCLRGVVMTAAEMGCRDRFSSVMIRERAIQTDNLETITIEGVSDVIRHLPEQPPVVFVFLVCMHIFVGSDEDYMIRKLADRWPGIRFVRGYMDCIRQKEGPTPDMKLRMAEYEPIDPLPLSAGRVNVLGQDVPFRPDCELISLLTSRGYDVRQLQDCGTYQEFLALGDAAVNVCTYPNALGAVSHLSERMGSKFLYLSAAVSYDEIRAQILSLSETCGFDAPSQEWFSEQEALCEESLRSLGKALDGWSVAVDYTAHSRPLGIARLLISHGIRVECVFLDSVLEEEREAFEWLQEHVPDLELVSTILPRMVRYGRGDGIMSSGHSGDRKHITPESDHKVAAVGQKAAWYCQTGHFVNMIEGGGLWGYQGVRRLCGLLEEASQRVLDYRQIIPRKGMGWPSLCAVPSAERPGTV